MKGNSPQYLPDCLREYNNCVCNTRIANQITLNTFRMRTEKFVKFIFFILHFWRSIFSNLTKQSENIKKFKNIKSNEWSLLSIHYPQIIKLFSRLRLNFSHLNERKFRHKFKESVSPMCAWGLELESTQHFFFRCHFYHIERSQLLNSL